jgi:hypothetical protein
MPFLATLTQRKITCESKSNAISPYYLHSSALTLVPSTLQFASLLLTFVYSTFDFTF